MAIPKRIFFFWGNATMSWCRYMTLYSFRKLHPDWEIVLYFNDCQVRKKQWGKEHNEQDYFSWKGEDYFHKLQDLNIKFEAWSVAGNELAPRFQNELGLAPPHKSDLLQWCKLYEEGGIYSDMDILYVRPLDTFWTALNEEGVTGCIGCHNGTITIGWMASQPGNDLFRDIFKVAVRNYNPRKYQSTGAMSVYSLFETKAEEGALPLSKIQEAYPKEKLIAFPEQQFYLFRNGIHKIWNENVQLPKEVLGIHWYGGHPLSQGWNRLLDTETWEKHSNTFTTACRNLFES